MIRDTARDFVIARHADRQRKTREVGGTDMIYRCFIGLRYSPTLALATPLNLNSFSHFLSSVGV